MIDSPGPHKFTESVLNRLRMYDNKKVIGLDNRGAGPNMRSNLVVYQASNSQPKADNVIFSSNDSKLVGRATMSPLESLRTETAQEG